MTESTEVEVEFPDGISFPYYIQNSTIGNAISVQNKLINLLREKLNEAGIPYFYVSNDRSVIRIFYQNEDGIENYLFICVRRSRRSRGFYEFDIQIVLKYYNDSKESPVKLYDKSIYGNIDDYISTLIKELTGLQVYPSVLNWLGKAIRKIPPICFYEFFRIQYGDLGLLEALYYKIDDNLDYCLFPTK